MHLPVISAGTQQGKADGSGDARARRRLPRPGRRRKHQRGVVLVDVRQVVRRVVPPVKGNQLINVILGVHFGD